VAIIIALQEDTVVSNEKRVQILIRPLIWIRH